MDAQTTRICPHCHTPIAEGKPLITCDRCAAAYHPDCWTAADGCEACAGTPAPVEEKKAAPARRFKTSSVLAGAAIVSGGMLLSRIIGLVRENMFLGTFGDSNIAGAYNLAFVFPDLMYNLLAGGAMSAAFIPVFSSYLSKDQDDEAHHIGSTISTLLLLVMTVVAALGILFAPQLIGLLQLLQPEGKSLSPADIALTVSLARVMFLMLIFTAQSGHFTGILQSLKHFVTPVIVWLAYNVAIIGGIILSKTKLAGGSVQNPNIHMVAYSVVFGAFLLAAIQLPVVMKYGFRFKFQLDLKHEGVKKVLILFLPVMVGLALSQINLLLLPLVLGSRFGLPAVTDIRAANRLVLVPLGLFAIAISTAAFPKLAQQMALGENSAFRRTLAQSIKVILMLSIPSALAMFVLAEPITYLLWGGAKYGTQGVQASSFVLMLFSLGLVGLGLQQIITRAFYSMHDTLTPTIIGVGMVVASFLLAMYFSSDRFFFQYGSSALATTLMYTASTLLLIEILRRRMKGIGGRDITFAAVRIFIASLLMAATMYACAYWLAPSFSFVDTGGQHISITAVPTFHHWIAPHVDASKELQKIAVIHVPRLRFLFQVGASSIAGILVYALALWAMKVEELKLITDRFAGKFGKRKVEVVS